MTETVPWVKWRFDKWRNDEGLRMCGLAARGLWADLLAIMHGAIPYGHLSVNGRAPTPKQIASLVGMTTEKEVAQLLKELEENGVFSRNEEGLIFCRRLVRDNRAREDGRAHGLRGGNPALIHISNEEDNQDTLNGIRVGLTPPLNPEEEREKERESEQESAGAGPVKGREGKHVNGKSVMARMPTLNSDWSAWEWLTDGEVEVCGPNAKRRPCAGGFYIDGVAREVADAARIDGHSHGIDWRPVVNWLREGIPGDVIVSAIKRVASRDDYEPKKHLKYFDKPIHEAAGKALS